jgi:hypothetical protein
MPITINGTTGISGVDGSAGTPSIQGTDTNTGVFYPAADTVGISTGGTERLRVDSTGNLRFNSGYGSVATAYGCRAWVNFNGTGTVAIRASGNVTSITDNGTGDYTVNFTSAMPDVNYAAICGTSPAISVNASAGSWYFGVKTDTSGNPTTKSTSACRVITAYLTGPAGVADAPELYAAFFR